MAERQSFPFFEEARALSQIERIKLQSSLVACSLVALSNSGSNGELEPNKPISRMIKNQDIKSRKIEIESRKIKQSSRHIPSDLLMSRVVPSLRVLP